jgi:predicted transcriptional regulator
MSQSTATLLRIPQTQASLGSFNLDTLVHQKKKRVIRPRRMIVAAILEACRTPTVQHWIMVRARLGYDTFWKHMNELVSRGMMNVLMEGSKTLYSISEKGLTFLQELEKSRA